MFLVFLAYFILTGSSVHLTLWILTLPLLVLIMAGQGLGLGIIISSLTIKYRDLQQLVGFGVTLLMYATPVIYPLSTVTGKLQWIILANPMTAVVEIFRLAFLGTSTLPPVDLLYSAAFMFVVLILGPSSSITWKPHLWIRCNMSGTVISVENLSKSYQLGVIGTGTFRGDLQRWWARRADFPIRLQRSGRSDHGNRQGETIWALKDINFTVQQGEALGLLGGMGRARVPCSRSFRK